MFPQAHFLKQLKQGLPGLALLMVLFAVLVIGGAIYHGLRLREETLGEYRRLAFNQMRVGERELTNTFSLLERTLRNRGENWRSVVADPNGDAVLRQDIAQLPSLRSLSVVTAQGRVLASSVSGGRGRQLSVEAVAALAGLENIPMHVSQPWAGRDLIDGVPLQASPYQRGDAPFFTLAVQSYEAADQGLVWIVAVSNPDYFINILGTQAERSEFSVELFRYDGTLLVSTRADAISSGYSSKKHSLFSEWLPDREFGVIDPDLTENAPQMLAFRASRRYPLVLLARMPHEAVLKGWRTEVGRLAQGTAGVLVFVTLLALLLYRQQKRREVTERKIRGEIELAARVFDASYDGVIITDAERRIIRVNPAFTAMTGYTLDEVSGKTPQILASGQHDRGFYQTMWEAIRKHGQWQGELINRRKDGSELPERLAITTVQGANGQVTHYIGTFADITERRRQEAEVLEARERAEAASRSKSQFLAVMSHEIRTPLNGILGMAQLLRTTTLSAEEQQEYASTIFHSGQVLLLLLNDILDLSKVEAGKMELAFAPADPARVLGDVTALFLETAQGKGLTLHTDSQGLGHHCYNIDAIRLRQMVSNLLSNAIKFTDSGEIRLRVLETGRQGHMARLRFEVIDTGIGIPGDRQAELFQPFSQVDNSSTRRFGGSGLGLSIVASLARLMGGEVGVASADGQGSLFWFTLTAEVLEPSATNFDPPFSAQAVVSTTDKPEGAWILVAEDNPVNQKVARAMLKRIGRPMRVVENGQEALLTIQRGECPGLVLMDCQMPVMDGYEATRQIRMWQQAERQAGMTPPDISIIALTAGAFETEREACLAAGMNDFLAKPLGLDELQAMIEKWMPDKLRATTNPY